jgi:choline monooxygenase
MRKLIVDGDIASAKTLHKDFYTQPYYFEEAKEKIFGFCWNFAGDMDRLPEEGACYPFFLLPGYLEEPLLLTKDKAARVLCLSNVCTHRGNVLINDYCRSAHIRCRYHGRLFGLNGQMVSMPEFREVKNFPSPEDNLPSIPLFRWGKWLFTSLRRHFEATAFYQDMIDRLSWLPVQDFVYRPDLSRDYEVNAHWALYCENYLEGFHIPFVHSGLNAVIDYGEYTTELFRYSSLQLGIAKEEENCFDLPPGSVDYGKKVAAYYFWIFPNLMFNFYPWGLSMNIVQPLAPDKTKVSFLTYMWKEEYYDRGAGSDLDKVELEDEEIVQNVQKGIRSRFYEQGRYSVSREQGTHHFHRLIAEFFERMPHKPVI